MNRPAALCFALAPLLLAAAACDPYSPDLGDIPFRCEPADPMHPEKQRCPDGYHPAAVAAPVFCECRRDGAVDPGGGGGDADAGPITPGFTCNDDPFEVASGNEDTTYATGTPLCTGTATVDFPRLAICPPSDRDTFVMDVDTVGKVLTARIRYEQDDGALALAILNSGGTSVAAALVQIDQAVATYQVPAIGRYYAQIWAGSTDARNNYGLQLATN